MRLVVPSKLNLEASISFCNFLDHLNDAENHEFDFSRMGRVEPFGLLLTISKFRQCKRKYPNMHRRATNYKEKNCDYAAHMGFFRSIGLDYGKKPGEAKGSETYLPITRLDIQQLKEEALQNKEYIGETIETRSNNLAKVFCRGIENLERHFTYSFREIMRNITEHSQADSIWYTAQYWETYDLVELSFLDEGIGIKESLISNPIYSKIINNDSDALALAIQPGVTKAFGKSDRDDVWANTGYGLYMTSNLCKGGGDFVIASNNGLLVIDENGERFYNLNFNGTIVRMRLVVSKLNELQFVLNSLLKEGEKLARESDYSVKTASKISSMLHKK